MAAGAQSCAGSSRRTRTRCFPKRSPHAGCRSRQPRLARPGSSADCEGSFFLPYSLPRYFYPCSSIAFSPRACPRASRSPLLKVLNIRPSCNRRACMVVTACGSRHAHTSFCALPSVQRVSPTRHTAASPRIVWTLSLSILLPVTTRHARHAYASTPVCSHPIPTPPQRFPPS